MIRSELGGRIRVYVLNYPLHATAYYNRGRLYGRKGELDQAIADLERALELGLGGEAKQWTEETLETLEAIETLGQ